MKSESESNALPTPNTPAPNTPTPDPFLDILSEPEEHRRSGMKWLMGSGLLLTIGLAGWLGYKRYQTPAVEPIAVPTTTVEVGSVEITVTESGTVELAGQQTFKSPSDVTVEAVPVEERQRVAAGSVLLSLRDRNLQRELDNQQVTNQKSANTLARQQEIILERQDKLQVAQARLADSKSLFDRGFISEDDYRRDQQGVDEALSSLKDAQVELTNAELDIQNNQLTLENIRTQLTDNQIISPIDAIVLNVDVQPGDGVAQGGRLLTIGDPNKETVRLQLTTLNAAKVDVNMPVRVSVIGPEAQVFTGRISRVSPQVASAGEGNSSGRGGEQSGTVEAAALLDAPSNGSLIPGSSVSVEIILDQRQSVVTVPLTAIQSDGASQFVWLKDGEGRAQKQPVTVGLQNLQSAEIISGLQAGKEIAASLPPGLELTPGTPLADPEAFPPDAAMPPEF
ncbi:MAG: efflux RND transporter periplasmic adaptor subunit [Cyanobacteria bacterium J06598_3]